jgi:hypothetical protein
MIVCVVLATVGPWHLWTLLGKLLCIWQGSAAGTHLPTSVLRERKGLSGMFLVGLLHQQTSQPEAFRY